MDTKTLTDRKINMFAAIEGLDPLKQEDFIGTLNALCIRYDCNLADIDIAGPPAVKHGWYGEINGGCYAETM